MSDNNDPIKEYVNKVAVAALETIIDLYPVGDAQHGAVDVEAAIEGLCLTMAMLANQTGAYNSPTKRRALAEETRKDLLSRLNQLAAASRDGTLFGWDMATRIEPKH